MALGADVPVRCLSETLQSEDTYEPDASLSVRPYCAERLKLTKTDRPAVALEGLVGSDASPFLQDPVGTILKSDSELDGGDEVPKPYTDPLGHHLLSGKCRACQPQAANDYVQRLQRDGASKRRTQAVSQAASTRS